MTELDRAAALAALSTEDPTIEASLAETGISHYAGGDVERVALGRIFLAYTTDDGDIQRVDAQLGDRVQITQAQADRLDGLAVVAEVGAELTTPDEQHGEATDEILAGMNASDLVAFIKATPDVVDRAEALELARADDKQRKTVLEAIADVRSAAAE